MTLATGKVKTIEFALNELQPSSIVEAMKIMQEYDIPAAWQIVPVYDGHNQM